MCRLRTERRLRDPQSAPVRPRRPESTLRHKQRNSLEQLSFLHTSTLSIDPPISPAGFSEIDVILAPCAWLQDASPPRQTAMASASRPGVGLRPPHFPGLSSSPSARKRVSGPHQIPGWPNQARGDPRPSQRNPFHLRLEALKSDSPPITDPVSLNTGPPLTDPVKVGKRAGLVLPRSRTAFGWHRALEIRPGFQETVSPVAISSLEPFHEGRRGRIRVVAFLGSDPPHAARGDPPLAPTHRWREQSPAGERLWFSEGVDPPPASRARDPSFGWLPSEPRADGCRNKTSRLGDGLCPPSGKPGGPSERTGRAAGHPSGNEPMKQRSDSAHDEPAALQCGRDRAAPVRRRLCPSTAREDHRGPRRHSSAPGVGIAPNCGNLGRPRAPGPPERRTTFYDEVSPWPNSGACVRVHTGGIRRSGSRSNLVGQDRVLRRMESRDGSVRLEAAIGRFIAQEEMGNA